MPKELHYGDLIILQIALVEKVKSMDLSMRCGQYMVELIGKLDYMIGNIESAADNQMPQAPLSPTVPHV